MAFRSDSYSAMPGHRPSGFAYLGLLILLAVIGIASTATLTLGVLVQRRAAEEALLEVGLEFQQALASYVGATPAGRPPYPVTLDDLLKDPRTPTLRRHLRKLYADPITGKTEWALIAAPGGQGFIGVHSLSTARPIKRANFLPTLVNFDDKKSYTEWQFVATQAASPIINFSN
jgi:type II secretory pathway pseudopilin PulG